ncbi:hypothetical protein ACFYW8_13965 [Streptomyces sp. NPDC002742]|jgi:hypothetical protein|uniref:hypothetical protein n=1 Tax=unclassified Streptomyces TaxID=2593676 RepID=UPI00344A34CA
MSTASGASRDDHPVQAPGALLLCRAHPESVGPAAQLLRERMLLAGAGPEWSVLVPEGRPWQDGAEPVDRVLTGWATALAVGAPWPVLALWWDTDRSGFTLASGFRRTVGYEWLANGTPVGEDEAMRTFAARLGLDPVLDMQALEPLTEPDPAADAHARVTGLLAVLTRAGMLLPAGVEPGGSADRLRDAVRIRPDAEQIEWTGWRAAVGAELDVVESGGLGPWLRGPRARTLAVAQLAVGLPLTAWGVRRRSGGWIVTGAALMLRGALALAYDHLRAYD